MPFLVLLTFFMFYRLIKRSRRRILPLNFISMNYRSQLVFVVGVLGLSLGLIFWAAPVSAATIYVDGDALANGQGTPEEPANTFALALSFIVPGEENIIYATGTFAEQVDISSDKGGQSEDTRTIVDQWPGRSQPVNDVTLGDANGKPVYLAYYIHDAAYVTIRNQRTMGAKATNIWSQYSHNIVLENNITSNANEKGICVYGSQDVAIRGNTAFDNGLIGIYMPVSSERILVENNVAYGNAEHGILAGDGSKDITIRNNQAYNNNWKNIMGGGNLASRGARGETNLVIEDNTVWGGSVGVTINGWSNVTIQRNDVRDTLNDGISVRGTVNAEVDGNMVTGSEGGISIAQTQNAIADANVVQDTDRAGMMVMGGANVTVQNNVLVRNNMGVNLSDPVGVLVLNNTVVDNSTGVMIQSPTIPVPEVTVGNNIFADNPTVARILTTEMSKIVSDFNAFSGYQVYAFFNGRSRTLTQACKSYGKDCHSQNNLDPLFVNPLLDDYHLQMTSPLIGRGRVTGAPETDMDGDNRAQDGKVDIGADEVNVN